MSIFGTSSLYKSLDSNATHLQDEEASLQSPFIAQPLDSIQLIASHTSHKPARRAPHNNAKSALFRPHTQLRNDLFEIQEEMPADTQPAVSRGRPGRPRLVASSDDEDAPPASLLYEASSSKAVPRSPSISPSRSPPADFTRQTPDIKGKGRATEADASPKTPDANQTNAARSPFSSNSTLHLGGARSWAAFRPGSRRNTLTKRQRALWLWVNVEDLDAFLTDVYTYYVGKGIYCIALERLLNLLTVGFVISFSTFLLGCIDYSVIRQKHTLADVLIDRCISRFHPFTLFMVLLFTASYAWRAVQFGRAIRRLWGMHEFFEELLGIPENDIQTVPWHVIVTRLASLRAEHPASNTTLQDPSSSNHPARLDAHDIANRVMRETNYMIALFNRELLDFTVPWPHNIAHLIPWLQGGSMTKVLEWNVSFCLMRYLFGMDGKVKAAFLGSGNRDILVEGLKRRFILMGFVNAILAPFIVVYLLIYSFFRYFEEYHKNPSSIGSRSFTELAKWRFREYNELPHLFKQRIAQAHAPALTYLDQFPKERTALISSFVAFVAGSFASVLVLFSLLDPDAFLHFEVTKDRSVLFYIGVFGTILAIARGMVPEDHRVSDPEKLMLEIADHTHFLPDDWRGRLHSTEVHAAFSSLFQLKITTFFNELFSVLTTPFVLWYTLPKTAPQIIDFFREFSIHVDGLGYVCSFGVFDFKRRGGTKEMPFEAPSATNEGKLDKSLLNFKSAYPSWQPRDQSSSLYLSHLQTQAPSFSRKGSNGNTTRFGTAAGMASTIMADSTTQEARARQYEQAFTKAGRSSFRFGHHHPSDGDEQEILEEGYADERTGLREDVSSTSQGDRESAVSVPDSMMGLLKQAYTSEKQKGW